MGTRLSIGAAATQAVTVGRWVQTKRSPTIHVRGAMGSEGFDGVTHVMHECHEA